MIEKNLYVQEIEEINQLLKAEWEDIRAVLERNDFDMSKCLLASFYEDEKENAYLIVVDQKKRIFDCILCQTDMTISIKDITHEHHIRSTYPQIDYALSML